MSTESIISKFINTKLAFMPVVTKDERVHQQESYSNGTVYFTTDTGKIYMDMDNQRVVLGGSGAAVLYCDSANIVKDVEGNYIIPYRELSGNNVEPREDDLIINSDGRFFRVNSYNVSENNINCSLIAVSGTGGSGGGGGDSSGGESDSKNISVEYHNYTSSFLAGQPYAINLTASTKKDTSLQIAWEVYSSKNLTMPIDSGVVNDVPQGTPVSLSVGDNITPEGGYHRIDITITAPGFNTYKESLNRISCIDLRIAPHPDFNNHQIFQDKFINYHVNTYGQIQKTFHIEIDGVKEYSKILPKPQSSGAERATISIDCSELQAGRHTIKAWLQANGIPSDYLYTDFIYHPSGTEDTTYILVSNYPTRVYSYENPSITYWVYDTASGDGKVNEIELYVNGVRKARVYHAQYKESDGLIWNVSGLNPDATNVCTISSGGGEPRSVSIYCEKSNIFDETEGAVLSLNADGRSNDVSLTERLQWSYDNIQASLLNFNWKSNGWMPDDDGRDCLRLNNGASVEIPLTLFTENPSSNHHGYTLEFEFKAYNLYSYRLLTQSTKTEEDESDKEDDAVIITRAFDSNLASIKYINDNASDENPAYGMCCGTQDAFFRLSNGDHVTARYMEDKIVNVAVTIEPRTGQILIYIDGIASGMTSFIPSVNSKLLPAASKIIINSEHCDLDLYSIRIYETALTSQEIVQNYIASRKDLNIAKQNAFASGDSVSFTDLTNYNTDNPDNQTIPYIIFKTLEDPDVLPFFKENEDVICDITFINPALDRAFDLKVNGMTEEQYKKQAPSFQAQGVTLNVQGTSSQKYPRKNFKGKFKKAIENKTWKCTHKDVKNKDLDIFYMSENIGESTFTWKADYMDSSSCHNTGFASYAHDLYFNHPLDYYYNTNVPYNEQNKDGRVGQYHQKYRTTLYGFPVLAFHQKSNGDIEFIGRYNFNLDKSADNTLGMNLEVPHTVLPNTTFGEICECWEFANNKGGRCSFRGESFSDGFVFDEQGNISGMTNLNNDLEVRYNSNDKAIEAAWKNKDVNGNAITPAEAYEILLGGDQDGNNRTGAYKNLEILFKWLQSCYFAFDLNSQEDVNWAENLLGRPLNFDEEGNLTAEELDKNNSNSYAYLVESRKTKFKTEFNQHLNLEYCLVYYIMTELLLQYDSRGKNMMLASWGPMTQGGDYIWFPIFYDIDTQLGVNNSGVPSWEYNVEPTTGFNNGNIKTFSTASSLLWNNIHEAYVVDKDQPLIEEHYRKLRGGALAINKLNGYYNFDYDISKQYCMKGIIPNNIINADQNYKYIAPSTKGYVNGIDSSTGKPLYRTTSDYFYCLQGTRSLHRAQFLRNRFNYYDSKWKTQDYSPEGGSNTIRLRTSTVVNKNDPSLNSNLMLRIKPILDQYIVAWADSDANISPVFAKGGQIIDYDLSKMFGENATIHQSLIYIGGYKNLQEIGNISLLYTNECEFPADAKSLVKIELGNDNPNYSNKDFPTGMLGTATLGKPLLKVFDITNLPEIQTELNLSDRTIEGIKYTGSTKLEVFKALGTNLTNVTFSPSVNLKYLYLPKSVTSLDLSHAPNLKKIIYNKDEISEVVDGVTKDVEGIYIDDVVILDANGNPISTNIKRINVEGGNLDLHTYYFTDKVAHAVLNMEKPHEVELNLKEVHWTPYTQVDGQATYDENNTYVYATNNYSYREYEYNKDTWNRDVLEGRIYIFEPGDLNSPTSLNNEVDNKDLLGLIMSNDTIFKNPTITGDLYINNNSNNPISEALIANTYIKKFPGLTIRANYIKNAYRVRFVHTYDNDIDKEIVTYRYDTATNITTGPEEISNPANYKFYGWTRKRPQGVPYIKENATIKDEDIIKKGETFSFTIDDNLPELTLYAIYERNSYDIKYWDKFDKDTKQQIGETQTVVYGDLMAQATEIPMRDESHLPFNMRYTFKGWTQNDNKCGILSEMDAKSVIEANITNLIVDREYNFYAVYVEEDALIKPSDSKYFDFSTFGDGLAISLHSDYKDILPGKITLPAKHEGKDVIKVNVNGFSNTSKITDIFFELGSNYQYLDNYAFFRDAQHQGTPLKNVYLLETITTINDSVFRNQSKMEYIALNSETKQPTTTLANHNIIRIGNYTFQCSPTNAGNFKISELPKGLKTLGEAAFAHGGSNITISALPSTLEGLPKEVFKWANGVKIMNFGSDADNAPQSFVIGLEALAQPNHMNNNGLQKIWLLNNVTRVEQDAFSNYGLEDLVAIASKPGSDTYISGFTPSTPTGNTGLPRIEYPV